MLKDKVESVLNALKDRGFIGDFHESGDTHFGFSCLFGERHRAGYDSNPSMTVLYGDEASLVKCHACGYGGTLREAVRALAAGNEGLLDDLVTLVNDSEEKSIVRLKKKAKEYVPVNYTEEMNDILAAGLPQEALDFLTTKGCTEYVIRAMRCGWVEDREINTGKKTRHVNKTIVFPVYSTLGGETTCIGAQARPIAPSAHKRSKYYTLFPFKAGRHVYGEHLLPKVRKRWLFIVEGPLDCLHFLGIGFAAVGLFGLNIKEEKIALIKNAGARQVFVLLDPDQNATNIPRTVTSKLQKGGVAARLLTVDHDIRGMTRDDVLRLVTGRTRSGTSEGV